MGTKQFPLRIQIQEAEAFAGKALASASASGVQKVKASGSASFSFIQPCPQLKRLRYANSLMEGGPQVGKAEISLSEAFFCRISLDNGPIFKI